MGSWPGPELDREGRSSEYDCEGLGSNPVLQGTLDKVTY